MKVKDQKMTPGVAMEIPELAERDSGCCYLYSGSSTTKIANITRSECKRKAEEHASESWDFKEGKCP